jgi:hypothetical protein
VACDDTYAPLQYFSFFKFTRIKIHVVPTPQDGTCATENVLGRLLEYDHDEDDERWLLLDTDHYTEGSHLQSFVAAIREAKRHGVNVALSRPCFEVWLLLHHVDEDVVRALSSASEVQGRLRAQLGQYSKRNLKSADYPRTRVKDAFGRAERLDGPTGGKDIPPTNATRVYQLWRAIFAKALPNQLPPEFRELIP